MQGKIGIVRRIVIALVSAFVAYRLGSGLVQKGVAQFDPVDYAVILPCAILAALVFVVCVIALWRGRH